MKKTKNTKKSSVKADEKSVKRNKRKNILWATIGTIASIGVVAAGITCGCVFGCSNNKNVITTTWLNQDSSSTTTLEGLADITQMIPGSFQTYVNDELVEENVSYWIKSCSIPNWQNFVSLYGENDDGIVIRDLVNEGKYDLVLRTTIIYDNHQEFADTTFTLDFAPLDYLFSATYDGSSDPRSLVFLNSSIQELEPKFNVNIERQPESTNPKVIYEVTCDDQETQAFNPRWDDDKKTVVWDDIQNRDVELKFTVKISLEWWEFNPVYIPFDISFKISHLPYDILNIDDQGCLLGFKVDFSNHETYELYKDKRILKLPSNVKSIAPNAMFDQDKVQTKFPDYIMGIDLSECNELSEIPDYAFAYSRLIKTVILPTSTNCKLTRIGKCAFTCATNLSQINLPDSLTIIDDNAFSSSAQLIRSFVFPSSLETIGADAFDSSLITGADFTKCSNLKTVGNGCFAYCNYLETVSFAGLQNLQEIDDCAFDWCGNLKTCNLEGCINLEKLGNLCFFGDVNLEKLILKDEYLKLNSLRYVGNYCFSQCTNLSSKLYFYVGDKPDSDQNFERRFTIGHWAFANCKSLGGIYIKTVNVPNTDKDKKAVLNVYTCAFMRCDNISITGDITGGFIDAYYPYSFI